MTPSDGIRVRVVQMEVLPGRPVDNTARILREIAAARSDGIRLLVFPEMCVPGYLVGDEWEYEAFLRECEACNDEIRRASSKITVLFGSVAVDWKKRNEDGRVRKYNALFVAEDTVLKGPDAGPYPFVVKTLMPNYREFDDSRHFSDLRKLAVEQNTTLDRIVTPVTTSVGRLGCALCEDAWDVDYGTSPLSLLTANGADVLVNVSSSPFTMNKGNKRARVFASQAKRLGRPLIFANNVGIQNNGKTVFTFDGLSAAYDPSGNVLPCGRAFEDGCTTFELPAGNKPFGTATPSRTDGIPELATAILYGTRKFMNLCGVRKVTVGVSGGIDSAVVASIYRTILPAEDILLLNMPSRFNSNRTRSDAAQLAAGLGCCYAEVPIEESVALTTRQLDNMTVRSPDGSISCVLSLTGLIRENIQARDRGSRILAAAAAAFGGVFTCNANKAEATVGYSTFYGDLAGFFANIADLWKMEVYELGRHLNKSCFPKPVIPDGIFAVTPSAELSADQDVNQGKGDPLVYPYHDALFRSWVEPWNRATPEDILEWYAAGKLGEKTGFAGRVNEIFKTPAQFIADLEKWWQAFQGMGLAKRIQAPPVLAVKRRAFGFDYRESQMGPRYTRRYEALKKDLLKKT